MARVDYPVVTIIREGKEEKVNVDRLRPATKIVRFPADVGEKNPICPAVEDPMPDPGPDPVAPVEPILDPARQNLPIQARAPAERHAPIVGDGGVIRNLPVLGDQVNLNPQVVLQPIQDLPQDAQGPAPPVRALRQRTSQVRPQRYQA